MNVNVEVTWRTLRTVAHSLIVYARVSEAYVHFAFMYTTDHIFPVLPIKYLINQDSDLTTPHKTCNRYKTFSVTFTCVIFSMCCTENYGARLDKDVKYASSSTKMVLRYLRWYSRASKRISCVRNQYKEDNIFI